MRAPTIEYRDRDDNTEAGYHVGVALDELAAFALDAGMSTTELFERLEESIDRALEEGGV